ncbi:hypothetical protein GW17_00038323 [Ensete ventricosum]|nr:hypothetical protein GW17_00038323 [Ensete ventricosum]
MRLGTRQECIGSFSKVSGVCQDDAREFVRRRPRLTERLSRVAEKLVGIGRSPEEDRKTRRKNAGGCRTGRMSDGCTATAQAFGQLTCPGWAVEPPVPRNLGTFGG